MEIKKLAKLILLIFLGWLVVTYVPNKLLRNWIFILFVFADFYFVAYWYTRRRRNRDDLVTNIAIVGLLILGIVSVVLNRMGF